MREQVWGLVRNALQELNEELQYESLEEVSEKTPIFGGEESIDSLSLVSLIVNLESEIQSVFGSQTILSDERAMSVRNSPYRTAGSLVAFVLSRLSESNE